MGRVYIYLTEVASYFLCLEKLLKDREHLLIIGSMRSTSSDR